MKSQSPVRPAAADEDNDGKSFSMEEKKENARMYNEGIERILV